MSFSGEAGGLRSVEPEKMGDPDRATPSASRKKGSVSDNRCAERSESERMRACLMAGPAAHRAQEPDKGNAASGREQGDT